MSRRLSNGAVLLLWCLPLVVCCNDALRLVVVEQGETGGTALTMLPPNAGSASGGSVPVIPNAGNTSEAGTAGTEPSGGGALGVGGDAPLADGGERMGEAGASSVPIWDLPPRYTASFVSHAYPGQYMRHQEAKGIIAPIDLEAAADREAATFDMIPGLYKSSCLSFRAVNKKGTFLRHTGSRIYLHAADDTPLYQADATFCPEPGMADMQGVTFRSSNYETRVIHLRNKTELWIDDVPDVVTPEFASESTFYREASLADYVP